MYWHKCWRKKVILLSQGLEDWMTLSLKENLIYLQMDATDEGQIRDAVQWTKHHVGK